MRPTLPRTTSVLAYLETMERAHIYSNFGPLVKELEARYADRLGVASRQVATVANATLGLAGAMHGSMMNSWTMPAWTFPATADAAILAGQQPSFADVDLKTWLLDQRGDSDTGADKGWLPVIPFGSQFKLSDLPLHEEHVIIDAAASLGNFPNLRNLPETWAVVFSLHATKLLGCGEGGLVVFGSGSAADKFRAWSNFGFAGSRIPSTVGTNAKMSEISAAYALAALDEWPSTAAKWETQLARAGGISTRLGILRSPGAESSICPYWIGVFPDEVTTRRVEDVFASKAISTRRWWPQPLTESSAFTDYSREAVPNSDLLSRRTLGLPMHLALTREDFARIENTLETVV